MSIKSLSHQFELHKRFDELFLNYQTIILWDELYLWYGVQKIAAGTYRDLLERWEAYLEARGLAANARPLRIFYKRQQGIFAAIFRTAFKGGEAEDLTALARR